MKIIIPVSGISRRYKIDIVIPSYINDYDCIIDCIKNLSLQTIQPNNIIVCISEINHNQKHKLEMQISDLKLNFTTVIHHTEIPQNASQNRNRGIDYCLNNTQPDYIMFCDCDDITHTKKIEYFLYCLTINSNLNIWLHSYVLGHENFDIYYEYNLDKAKLVECFNNPNNTNLYTIPELSVHHGHPIVKLAICKNLRYNENMNYGEDGDFCQRVNNEFKGVYCFTEKLLKYNI